MKTVDFIYRFDARNTGVCPPPASSEEAREILEDGNRLFAQWTDSCQREGGQTAYVVECSPQDLGLADQPGEVARQAPFAAVLGCADARVPAEMIFGQMRNSLFVVRVAGNVLSDECLGSIEYAVHHLADSMRVVVVLGHTGCGAVKATVETYLNPWAYLEKIGSPALRSIVDRLLMPVRKAANAIKSVWGSEASLLPGYHDALVETAVFVNAAQAAYNLRQQLTQQGKANIQVLYGVFDLKTHRIWTVPDHPDMMTDVRLAEAPASLGDFEEVTIRMAIRMAKRTGRRPPSR